MASTSLDPPAGVTRPVVFFDINIGETPAGRIKIGKSLISGGLTSGGKHEAWSCGRAGGWYSDKELMIELFSDITPKYAYSTRVRRQLME
jgi:hypothetical protein